eukprot:CAMPEP_0167754440 /NCGR_PEP_ID=MMETSP0110_2-20121227/8267_1 /TAXON_ID=629695 /ORGANISM="Gymnochlora sp., Strain CCMP2014" /LENGTH=315 /DNA_ID=CAMNT_0007640311 /DNA_START=117 /DNA_END=1064 /DNA_ORIENTATION=+
MASTLGASILPAFSLKKRGGTKTKATVAIDITEKEKIPVKIVTFDFTGTLGKVNGPTEDHYIRALQDVIDGKKLVYDDWNFEDEQEKLKSHLFPAFVVAYKDQMRRFPNFGYGKMTTRRWWDNVIYETFSKAGLPKEVLNDVKEPVGRLLYDNFAKGDVWILFPEVLHMLDELKSNGIRMGVVSNFDERLEGILKHLGILGYFKFVLTSVDIGIEKPSPAIFEKVMELSETEFPEEILHVGDTIRTDVEGAMNMGMPFVFVERDGEDGALAIVDMLKERGLQQDYLAPGGISTNHTKCNVVRSLASVVDIVESHR